MSSVSKSAFRLPGSFLKGLSFNRSSNSLIAPFNSTSEKNTLFRSLARIHLWTTYTPTSTFALSLGFLTLAGITATP